MKFGLLALTFQFSLIIMFAFLVDYDPAIFPSDVRYHDEDPQQYYHYFQDVHVMMFVGFGFLLVFPYLYSWSAVVFNFMMGAFVIQWAILNLGFFHKVRIGNYTEKIGIEMPLLIDADYCVAAVLISYSGVLGRLSPIQYLFMAFVETMVYAVNQYICVFLLGANDIGGSITIHLFGAYFGLSLSLAHQLFNKKIPRAHPTMKTSYSSDLMAMIGTLFLWMFWPSFNAALAVGANQYRTVINTLLAMTASCFTTFALTKMLRDKFAMVDIQNASLAGGVAVGAAADMFIHGYGALLVGMIAGTISTLGYIYLTPFLERMGLLDTAGINNLHGMPGFFGGVVSIFAALASFDSDYGPGGNPGRVFPRRAPSNETYAHSLGLEPGMDWTAARQAGAQCAALFTALAMGLVGGFFTGLLLRLPFCNPVEESKMYSDHVEFLLEEEHGSASKHSEEDDEDDEMKEPKEKEI